MEGKTSALRTGASIWSGCVVVGGATLAKFSTNCNHGKQSLEILQKMRWTQSRGRKNQELTCTHLRCQSHVQFT